MPAKHIEVKTFKLSNSSSDTVKIQHIEKPYGEYSSPVVSIGIYSEGETKISDVEIPYENIEVFLKALHESIDLCESIPRSKIYAELNSDIGGGA